MNVFITLFNFKEKFYHRYSDKEIELIKKTNLFTNTNDTFFSKLAKFISLVKYRKGDLVIREGEHGDDLYFILNGSVRVFTYDMHGNKVPLARLNEGDYFGELALLGMAQRSRNANIETIIETTLIKIKAEQVFSILNIDASLKKKLQTSWYQQALTSLSLTTKYFNELEKLISEIKEPETIEFNNDELIFNIGDQSDNVYLILKGEVKLLIPDSSTKNMAKLILHKGHLFGEMGILNNKPRAATAVANSNVHMLVINGKFFREFISKNSELKQLLSKLQQVYKIPLKANVEQYVGNGKDTGPTITNIYRMDDGRTIISSNILTQDICTFSTVNTTGEKQFKFEKGANKLELSVVDNKITGIKAYGVWDELPTLCQILLEARTLQEDIFKNFEITGKIITPKRLDTHEESEIVCECLSVTKKQLQEQINKGIDTLEGLSNATGACTSCKGCQYRILQMLGKGGWISGVMKKIRANNDYINSYNIRTIDKSFDTFKPGQHLIIQIKVGNNWIERPYSISDLLKNGELRITIKKEPKGFFTPWLFEEESNEIDINIMGPQGDFILNLNDPCETLCFAGGIGITPFITFAKALSFHNSNKKMHIIYCALAQKDFIFMDEFNEIANNIPNFSIFYRGDDKYGLITNEEIIEAARNTHEADIYICGPEGFVQLVENTLSSAHFDRRKIYIEKFVHAGGVTA